LIDRCGQIEFRLLAERAQLRDRIVGVARDRQELLDGLERVARQRAAF